MDQYYEIPGDVVKGDAFRILKDPVAWHVENVDLEVRRIGYGIESLEHIIEKANAKILKLKELHEQAKKRADKVKAALKKLKPGDQIPAILLPNAADMKDEAKRIARQLREDTNDDAGRHFRQKVEGWYGGAPTLTDKKITYTFYKDGTCDLPPVPEMQEGFTAEEFTIDRLGQLTVKMVAPANSRNLGFKHILENLKAGLEKFKELCKSGKARTEATSASLKAFVEGQRKLESGPTEQLRSTLEKYYKELASMDDIYNLDNPATAPP